MQQLRSEDFSELRTLAVARLCDPTGCYMAWNVVDSDGDGVCDADELIAGTDPHDPLSKPSLRVVAELGGKSTLPSFEAGLGVFAVYPEQMQAMLQQYYKDAGKGIPDQLTAFPLHHERGDALSRAGISADLLAQNGIDAERDGFTIGLDHPTASGLPGRRVGGIETRLISADDKPKEKPKLDDLAPLVPMPARQTAEVVDGKPDADGTVRTYFKDGSGMSRDANGKVIRVWYTNPDADASSTKPTDEQIKAMERLRGAAIQTVENWEQPGSDDPKAVAAAASPRKLIMLVDPLIVDAPSMVLNPRFCTAQPETVRDELPKPGLPAGDVPPKGSADCRDGCIGTP